MTPAETARNIRLREAAGMAIRRLVPKSEPVLTWAEIRRGFEFEGERVLFANKALGIFKPAQLTDGAPLSIRTSNPSRSGRTAVYDDLPFADGVFRYKLQGDSPDNHHNRGLLEAWRRHLPLIYFLGIGDAVYSVLYPVFIERIDTQNMEAIIVVGDEEAVSSEQTITELPGADPVKRYCTHLAKTRVHQAIFREQVLAAYDRRCALTGLPVPKLLEAAHIIPDTKEHSLPTVPNGICMSKLHHAAFDSNLIGIDPDGVIHVNRDLALYSDGPLLEVCLKQLEGGKIRFPANPINAPAPEYLEERFDEFLKGTI